MMLVRTYVAPSLVEGVGVFAAESIEAGQMIWRFDPDFDRLVPASLAVTGPGHMREFIARYAYPSPEDADSLILETDNGRFMNHGQSPNTDFTRVTEGFALRRIEEGEELICDYSEFDPTFELLPSFLEVPTVAANGHLPEGMTELG